MYIQPRHLKKILAFLSHIANKFLFDILKTLLLSYSLNDVDIQLILEFKNIFGKYPVFLKNPSRIFLVSMIEELWFCILIGWEVGPIFAWRQILRRKLLWRHLMVGLYMIIYYLAFAWQVIKFPSTLSAAEAQIETLKKRGAKTFMLMKLYFRNKRTNGVKQKS